MGHKDAEGMAHVGVRLTSQLGRSAVAITQIPRASSLQ